MKENGQQVLERGNVFKEVSRSKAHLITQLWDLNESQGSKMDPIYAIITPLPAAQWRCINRIVPPLSLLFVACNYPVFSSSCFIPICFFLIFSFSLFFYVFVLFCFTLLFTISLMSSFFLSSVQYHFFLTLFFFSLITSFFLQHHHHVLRDHHIRILHLYHRLFLLPLPPFR